jgi:succinate dehydrogenase / fumarate reductase, membrane anchor subunit
MANRFLTDRKRAEGRGSAHAGVHHHWAMTVSSVALLVMVPIWIFVFGAALGGTRDEVAATFGHPFVAILTGLMLVVGMRHFAMGATTMIEDYARGMLRQILIIGVTALSWVIAATGLFALARMAL